MLVFDEEQQHAVVGIGIANAPAIKQGGGETLRLALANAGQSDHKDVGLLANGA